MPDLKPQHDLDAPPQADAIASYRDEAQEAGADVVVRYPNADGETRHLVVSPRGTCVVLKENVSRDAFAPQKDAASVADALRV